MIRILQTAFLCLITSTLWAQFIPNSNQAFQFAPAINPAFTGVEGFRDLKLSYRYQWTGFGSNAPHFVNLAFNFRVKEPLDLTLHALRTGPTANTRKKDDVPKLKKAIHGLGGNLFYEGIGPISRVGAGIHYAFHYPITNTLRLAAGVSAILDNTRYRLGEFTFTEENDPFYANLLSAGANHAEINVRGGILLYSPRYYVGFSYYPILNSSIKNSDITVDKLFYKGSFQGGVSFPVTSTIDIKPSVLAFLQMDNKFSIDYNVKMYIEQKLWFGVTYRDTKSLVGLVGFNLNELLGASYSYEVSTGGMQQFSNGSHELVLGLRFNNFKRLSPQIW